MPITPHRDARCGKLRTSLPSTFLPYYANSHTESSFCGAYTTRLRNEARSIIAQETNAQDGCSVIFTGSGATAAINRLAALSGVTNWNKDSGEGKSIWGNRETKPTIFIGPYEHHSNILPWRESGAEVVEIEEAAGGGPNLEQLEKELAARKNSPVLIGSFSAASNVTGIITDADAVTPPTQALWRIGILGLCRLRAVSTHRHEPWYRARKRCGVSFTT